MEFAQQLIDEIIMDEKHREMIRKISDETLKQWSKYGIEPYLDNEELKNEK